ncbi:MAG: LCP family protein [Clostridiales bacterium]|nr:LCP family protein [Clostridiales bacterium]
MSKGENTDLSDMERKELDDEISLAEGAEDHPDDLERNNNNNDTEDENFTIESNEFIFIEEEQDEFDMDVDWDAFNEALKQQVEEELAASDKDKKKTDRMKTLRKRVLKIAGASFGILFLFVLLLVGTKGGRRVLYRIAGSYIHGNVDLDDSMGGDTPVINPIDNNGVEERDSAMDSWTNEDQDSQGATPEKPVIIPRQEDYVSNFLIFGIEEIDGAKNTDAIMLASINTKDDTIKLTSLLRDTLVEIPGHQPDKLNSVYARGGTDLLVETVEQNYRIKIEGYASINFNSFEAVVNLLGGVPIELGEEEAKYLNRTNYISNPAYRNVVPGSNLLNGNQALGYCRIRRVPTIGGANDDYGRTQRQRKVISAIFNRYKNKNLIELFTITSKCLGYVRTNVTKEQIEGMLEDIIENKITKLDTCRIPANGMFDDPSIYMGVKSPLVLQWDDNIKELHQFIFLDEEESDAEDNVN